MKYQWMNSVRCVQWKHGDGFTNGLAVVAISRVPLRLS